MPAAPARSIGLKAASKVPPALNVQMLVSSVASSNTTILPSKSAFSAISFVGVSSASPSHTSPRYT